VTTAPASGVQEEQATLNGPVNGNGLNTEYRFEYGKTAAYGSSTSWVGAGSGASNPSASVAGLQPGTTYHYRIVATSSAGTSFGGDQTFTTVSRPSSFIQANGYQTVFYPGRNNAIDELLYTSSWLTFTPGGEPTGNPTAVYRESTGEQWVFYRGQNGAIQELFYYNGSWDHFELGGAAAGSPSASIDSKGNQYVFFRGTNGDIWEYYWPASEGKWDLFDIGGSGGAVGEPAVFRRESTNEQGVFYRGTNGAIQELFYYNGSWDHFELGGAAAGSPSASIDSKGNQYVFFRGTNDEMWEYYWPVSEGHWDLFDIGGTPE
jgi:hypothetical protein